jgi:hypothetical protein
MDTERANQFQRRCNLVFLCLVACNAVILELKLARHLWNTNPRDSFGLVYLLINLLPISCAFIFRRRINRWLESGEMSPSASTQMETAILMLTLFFYIAPIGAEFLH